MTGFYHTTLEFAELGPDIDLYNGAGIWFAAGRSTDYSIPCDPSDNDSPYGFGIRDLDPDLVEAALAEERCVPVSLDHRTTGAYPYNR